MCSPIWIIIIRAQPADNKHKKRDDFLANKNASQINTESLICCLGWIQTDITTINLLRLQSTYIQPTNILIKTKVRMDIVCIYLQCHHTSILTSSFKKYPIIYNLQHAWSLLYLCKRSSFLTLIHLYSSFPLLLSNTSKLTKGKYNLTNKSNGKLPQLNQIKLLSSSCEFIIIFILNLTQHTHTYVEDLHPIQYNVPPK